MQALIIFFAELCTLRRAPQDLPASEILLMMALLANLLAGVLVGVTATVPIWTSLLQGVIETATTLAALAVALYFTRIPGRFRQSATALLGSGALLGWLALLPLSLDPAGGQASNLAALGAFLLLGLVIWGFVVTGHILRHTFGISLGLGSAIAMVFEMTNIMWITALFGST